MTSDHPISAKDTFMPAFTQHPTITGDRIRLRPFRDTDHDALWAMVNDAEGGRLTGTHTSFTREQIERWYSTRDTQRDRLDLAIATIDDDACVGEIVLNDLDSHNRACSLRISLMGPGVFGRGYGSQAIELVLGHAFEVVGLHRVDLEVYAFNTRAIHVYRQCGFVEEGVRRDALWWEGTFHDALLMSMLAPEWKARCATDPNQGAQP